MGTRWTGIVVLLALLLCASLALAAEHPATHGTPALNWVDFSNPHAPSLLAMLFNFIVVAGLLFWIGRKYVAKAVKDRKVALETAIAEAEAQKKQAEEAMAVARERADALDLEMARIRRDVLNAGRAESERIEAEAQQKADRMTGETELLIKQEMARLAQRIRAELVDDVIALAKQKLDTRLTPADQERMTAEFLAAVSSNAARPPVEE